MSTWRRQGMRSFDQETAVHRVQDAQTSMLELVAWLLDEVVTVESATQHLHAAPLQKAATILRDMAQCGRTVEALLAEVGDAIRYQGMVAQGKADAAAFAADETVRAGKLLLDLIEVPPNE